MQQVEGTTEIMQADADKLFGLEPSQGVELIFDVVVFSDGGAQLTEHLLFGFFDASEIDADQRIDQLGAVEKKIGQKLALGKEGDQKPHGLGILSQQSEKPGAAADALAEFGQIQKRAVRRARMDDFVHQRRAEQAHYLQAS